MTKYRLCIQRKPDIPGIFRRIILAWLIAVTMEYFLLPGTLRDLSDSIGLAFMSFHRTIIITLSAFIFLFGVSRFVSTVIFERRCIVAVFFLLSVLALRASFSWAFLTACILIFSLLTVYGIFGHDNRDPVTEPGSKKERKVYLGITAGLSIAFFLFVSAWTVGRFYCFCTPTYDFGIFSQMFYYMNQYGLPLTTLERDGILSHFAVHVSPIFYVMLPFYRLVPDPATLQVLQAAVITSAVIPLWKIGKHHGLTPVQRMLICTVLFLYPSYSGGTSFDIHENCFLTPLLLWLFYGIDKKNITVTFLASILTLTVKEDGAVYVAVIALWLIIKSVLRFQKSEIQNLFIGIAMLAISLAWFYTVTEYLVKNGEGIMTYRYDNFMYDGSSSLIAVIKSVILNPMKAVYECTDKDKLRFIALTLLPLLGLPLLTRRYERYFLLIPYILINLMSDYPYQHDIFFQYTFGPFAFLIYLTVVNLADLKIHWHRSFALVTATVVCGMCFAVLVVPKAMYYPVQALRNYDYYRNIRNVLDEIPEEAPVAAGTFYTAYLSQREILYDLHYCSLEHLFESRYVVLGAYDADNFQKFAVKKQEIPDVTRLCSSENLPEIRYMVLGISAADDYQEFITDEESSDIESLIDFLVDNGYKLYRSIENGPVIYQTN